MQSPERPRTPLPQRPTTPTLRSQIIYTDEPVNKAFVAEMLEPEKKYKLLNLFSSVVSFILPENETVNDEEKEREAAAAEAAQKKKLQPKPKPQPQPQQLYNKLKI